MVLGKWLCFTRKPLVKIKRIKKKNSDIIAFLSTVDAKIEKKNLFDLNEICNLKLNATDSTLTSCA